MVEVKDGKRGRFAILEIAYGETAKKASKDGKMEHI